jgi:glycosyltransferase involved in cell wall biosynthesis
MEHLISVIIPVYKVERYLRECVDSVLRQTYKNIEIVLVDDGSPDNYGVICDEYAEKNKRIKIIHQNNAEISTA